MKFPTQLTVFRIVLAPVFYMLFTVDPPLYLWATIVFIVAAVTDWYDGYFARKYKLISRFGTFLDPLADKILTSVAFIAFAIVGMIPYWTLLVVIGRDIVMTALRAIADLHDMHVRTNMSAKIKTFVQMVYIIGILLILIGSQGTFGAGFKSFADELPLSDFAYWGMMLVVGLTLLTFLQYLYDNAALLRMIISRYIFRRSTQNP